MLRSYYSVLLGNILSVELMDRIMFQGESLRVLAMSEVSSKEIILW